MPIDKITTLVSSVTPGIYSAAQDDPSALRRYLLKPTEVLSLILFPVMAGLALVSKDAVLYCLGQNGKAQFCRYNFFQFTRASVPSCRCSDRFCW